LFFYHEGHEGHEEKKIEVKKSGREEERKRGRAEKDKKK
jgi:hypothetical protein